MNFGVTLAKTKGRHTFVHISVLTYIALNRYCSILCNSLKIENKDQNKLNANFITGLTDAEGSFIVIIRKQPGFNTG
jgi:prenyltransferase beta subunit